MTERRLCAAFYLPKGGDAPVERLADDAGITQLETVSWGPAGEPAVVGAWGGLDCEAFVLPLTYFDALVVTFREDEFRALRPGSENPATDPALSLTQAFRNACSRLDPAGAFITDHAWDDPLWYLAREEEPVLNGHLVALAHERLALLYLPAAEVGLVRSAGEINDRDTVAVDGGGLLLFRGSGTERWQRAS